MRLTNNYIRVYICSSNVRVAATSVALLSKSRKYYSYFCPVQSIYTHTYLGITSERQKYLAAENPRGNAVQTDEKRVSNIREQHNTAQSTIVRPSRCSHDELSTIPPNPGHSTRVKSASTQQCTYCYLSFYALMAPDIPLLTPPLRRSLTPLSPRNRFRSSPLLSPTLSLSVPRGVRSSLAEYSGSFLSLSLSSRRVPSIPGSTPTGTTTHTVPRPPKNMTTCLIADTLYLSLLRRRSHRTHVARRLLSSRRSR